MVVIERKVMICGQTGSGKSFVNNKLTLLPVPKTSQQEEDPNYGVISRSDFDSCSTKVLTKRSRNPVKYYLNSRGDEGQMTLYVTDTPGVPDTMGRSVNFLNEVMSFARENRPHGVVWVVDAVGRFGNDMELALQAAKECWNGQLTESKLHVFVNRVPDEFSLANDGEEEEDIEQVQAKKVDAAVRYVVKCLLGEDKVEGFRNYSWNLVGSHEGIKTLKLAIAKFDTPLTDQQAGSIRTWDELNTYYEDLETGAISAKEFQEQQLAAKESEKQCLEKDMTWHENRINDLSTASVATLTTGATLAFFTFGISGMCAAAATGGMLAAILSSQSSVERISGDIEAVDGEIQRLRGDHEKELEKEKRRCMALREHFKELQIRISSKCGPQGQPKATQPQPKATQPEPKAPTATQQPTAQLQRRSLPKAKPQSWLMSVLKKWACCTAI